MLFKAFRQTIKEDLPNLPDRVIETVGAIVCVLAVLFISNYFGLLNDEVALAIGFFTTLPIAFVFVFGIITNNPNFESTLRKISFLFYLIVIFVIYMFTALPTSILDFGRFTLAFVLGFSIVLVSGFIYLWLYRSLKKETYRMKASVSFFISTAVTLALLFIANYFNLLSWIE